MKIIISVVVALLLTAAVSAQRLMAVAGSYADDILLVDLKTDSVLRSVKLPLAPELGGECNSVTLMGKNRLLFSYKAGARLQTWDGDVIWDYKVTTPGAQELQSIVPTKEGYMAAICGNPSRFVFLDKRGEPMREVVYESGVKDVHAQFRQVRRARNGNILVPMMGTGKLVEIDSRGEQVSAFEVGGSPYSVEELPDGSLLVSGGAGVYVYTRNGEKIKTIALPSSDYSFLTQSLPLKNGGYILTNWQGHADNTQPQIFFFDKNLKLVKTLDLKKRINYVSAISLQ